MSQSAASTASSHSQDTKWSAMLKSKLMEGAGEVIGANTRTSMQEEIGDLLEVIDALIKTYGLNEADILLEKEAKYERSGGFEYPGTVMTGIRYHGGSK